VGSGLNVEVERGMARTPKEADLKFQLQNGGRGAGLRRSVGQVEEDLLDEVAYGKLRRPKLQELWLTISRSFMVQFFLA